MTPRPEMLKLWNEVKANHALLDACSRHVFGPPDKPWGGYRACANCGGRLDVIHAHWYERGLAHAKAAA
jgi:hydrogenase maturation factor HypF (carbamoyltransferase family)